MSSFHHNTKKSDLFQLLKQMQSHLFDFNTLEIFTLPKPVCLQNEYAINMFYLSNKWLDDFPSLKTIKKFIKDEKKLFYMPVEEDHYYLYYHLLVAYNNFLKLGKNKIYDDESLLDYDKISNYLIRKNLNATKFFEAYLEKVKELNDDDLVNATLKEFDEVTDYKFDEKFIPRTMTSEPTIVLGESEIEIEPSHVSDSEIEIEKMVLPLSSTQFENEIEEEYLEEKKIEIEEEK